MMIARMNIQLCIVIDEKQKKVPVIRQIAILKSVPNRNLLKVIVIKEISEARYLPIMVLTENEAAERKERR